MKEIDIRQHIQAFLRTGVRTVVMPATLSVGMAIGACGDSGAPPITDGSVDTGSIGASGGVYGMPPFGGGGSGGSGGSGGVIGSGTIGASGGVYGMPPLGGGGGSGGSSDAGLSGSGGAIDSGGVVEAGSEDSLGKPDSLVSEAGSVEANQSMDALAEGKEVQ